LVKPGGGTGWPQSFTLPGFASIPKGKGMAQDHPWYKTRRYLHFDPPVGQKQSETFVSSVKRVAQHSFYPFIGYHVTSKKVSHDRTTNTLLYTRKERPIAYAAHLDSQIYSFYAWKLSKLYEEKLGTLGISDSVLAFRPLGKSNIDFAAKAFADIRKMGECGVVALDATKFFDSLDHRLLKTAWQDLIGKESLPPDHFAVFKSLTRSAIVDKAKLYSQFGISIHNPKNDRVRICEPKEFRKIVRNGGLITTNKGGKGIPQGSPISALLSNIYMLNFDAAMKDMAESNGGKYYRYCDDMLFIVPLKEKSKFAGIASKEIVQLQLAINTKKTEIREFKFTNGNLYSDKPLQYLGFTFDGQQILIRSAALARYSEKMKRGVKFAKATRRKRNKLRRNRGESDKQLFRRNLYKNYSHLGRRNFVSAFKSTPILSPQS
jgi:RNA-directed DNA polymerase